MEKNTVVIEKCIENISKVIDISGDVIVPDIKPDIINIINTNGIAYIYKEDVQNKKVRLDGNIDIYVVYLSDTGDTRSIQTVLSFSEYIENEGITDKTFFKTNVIVDKIEAKVLNERKISIKATLKLECELYEEDTIELTTDYKDDDTVEVLKENINVKSLVGKNTVKSSIKQTINVDNALSIAEILKININLENIENKISFNKVLAKADCNINVLFLTEDGRVASSNITENVMSFIDLVNVTDEHLAKTDYKIRNMLFKIGTKESRQMDCQVDFEVTCRAYEIKELEIINDMYGLKKDLEFSKKEVMLQIASEELDEKMPINERIVLEDVLDIKDTDERVKVLKRTKSGDIYNHECEMNICFYYDADSKNGLNVKRVDIPFIVKNKQELNDSDFEITRKNYRVSSENVDCDMEIKIKQRQNSLKKVNIISDIKENQETLLNEYKMYMYFVKPGDTLWNIAKKFKIKVCDLKELNKLESDNLTVGDRLYIMR